MEKPTTININVDTQIKEKAEAILKDLGLDLETAINVFLIQVVKRNGIPFKIKNNHKDLSELEYMKAHQNEYQHFNNWEDLEKNLLSND